MIDTIMIDIMGRVLKTTVEGDMHTELEGFVSGCQILKQMIYKYYPDIKLVRACILSDMEYCDRRINKWQTINGTGGLARFKSRLAADPCYGGQPQ